MAHLATLFFFTFYAVIQANSKSVKIAENTFLKAKRQQYTLGKVVHCLFNINLYTWLAKYCYCKDKQANKLIYQQEIVWDPCGNPRARVHWCPGQYGGVGLVY